MVFFLIAFITIFIILIVTNIRRFVSNNTPIKQFRHNNQTYIIYAKKHVSAYSSGVSYKLVSNNSSLGDFASLNDILIFLNLDEFPN